MYSIITVIIVLYYYVCVTYSNLFIIYIVKGAKIKYTMIIFR